MFEGFEVVDERRHRQTFWILKKIFYKLRNLFT